MKYIVAAAALVATVAAQCQDSLPYQFQISPVNVTETNAGAKEKRQVVECTKTPIVTLQGGILKDQNNRQGEVVANTQFQFDNPLQPNNIHSSGFCVNSNGTLSIAGSAIFYSCISGTFSNLYTTDIGSVCSQVYLDAVQCSGGIATGSSSLSASTATGSSSSSSSATVAPTTTPATTAATTPTTVATVPSAPYPVGNATTPAGTASGAPSGTTTATSTTSSPAAFQPSSGANVLAKGGQLLAGAAALGAFALF